MAQTAQAQTFYEKPLFKLISGAFPEFRSPQGVFGVEAFGKAIGMSNEGIYKWFRSDKLTAAGAARVVKASKDPVSGKFRLTKEQFYPFCFPA